jgi:hypothetical protein
MDTDLRRGSLFGLEIEVNDRIGVHLFRKAEGLVIGWQRGPLLDQYKGIRSQCLLGGDLGRCRRRRPLSGRQNEDQHDERFGHRSGREPSYDRDLPKRVRPTTFATGTLVTL